jgi:hypothetical protein
LSRCLGDGGDDLAELLTLFGESIDDLQRRVFAQYPQDFALRALAHVQDERTTGPISGRRRFDRSLATARRSSKQLLGLASVGLLILGVASS